MKPDILTRPITGVEYHRLAEEGAFALGERVELLEGELVPMVPMGSGHFSRLNRAAEALMPLAVLRRAAIVSIQCPIALDNLSEPEPDVAVLIRREDFYNGMLPRPHDVFLAVEVADSTLKDDRDRKIPLYGQRGIRESWLVDLNAGVVTAYRIPSAKGYLEEKRFKRGEKLAPEAFPDFEVAVDDLLG
jgi:Uma2 family endonuclease